MTIDEDAVAALAVPQACRATPMGGARWHGHIRLMTGAGGVVHSRTVDGHDDLFGVPDSLDCCGASVIRPAKAAPSVRPA
jgi:hypothetical protein